jgi:hypothetical protein
VNDERVDERERRERGRSSASAIVVEARANSRLERVDPTL